MVVANYVTAFLLQNIQKKIIEILSRLLFKALTLIFVLNDYKYLVVIFKSIIFQNFNITRIVCHFLFYNVFPRVYKTTIF